MEIKISDEAAQWFQTELNLKDGSYIRFFARYGGSSPVQQGFSLGISNEEPVADIASEISKDGITYYVHEKDLWYFDGHNLIVEYDKKADEPKYLYQ
ncbi:HesB/YadR/YfhF family protein [Bacillus sp. B15-48]|uniref:HesB/YadR/YfhF family protein n=1 Tax=Bacillus sp. B15-48 TaxID=1548601 RepID=UPI00193F7A4A|nr:HesB/YadR/YfhF family protein [Bacillus sp. B15-48]MBM4763448.1 hypothetical protein [Bacillus sp. B15-48]